MESLFNEWCWKMGILHAKIMNSDISVLALTKEKSKWIIKDLYIKAVAIMYIEKIIAKTMYNIYAKSIFKEETL